MQTGSIVTLPPLPPVELKLLPVGPTSEPAPPVESPPITPPELSTPTPPVSFREFFIPNAYAEEAEKIATGPDIIEAQDLLFSKVIEMKKNEREDSEGRSLK